MSRIRAQVDDIKEFKMLTEFLGFDKSKSQTDLQNMMKNLQEQLEESGNLKIDPTSYINLIRSLTSFEMQVEDMIDEYSNDKTVIQMPENLYLLTPYFTFSFIELPGDYQRLVKEYYNQKCRNCKI